MSDFDSQFSQLKEVCETLSYEKESIQFDRFHFVFEEILSGDTLLFIDFFAVEKDVNLIHKLRISVGTEEFTTGLYFAFYNPFIKNHSITRVPLIQKEIDVNGFLIPLLEQHADVLIQQDFPLEEYLCRLRQ